MKKKIKLSENNINKVINETIKKFIFETTLNYDEDNFSGKYDGRKFDDYIDQEGYIDDPYNPPNNWDDNEWIDGDKDMENDYSWNLFNNNRPVSPGVGGYNAFKKGIKNDIDKALQGRHDELYWTDYDNNASEIKRGRSNMNGWVKNGDADNTVGLNWEVFKDMHPHKKRY